MIEVDPADTPTRLKEIIEPATYLSLDECQTGHVYWGNGGNIYTVAIAGIDEDGELQFEGLRNKLGLEYLDSESHADAKVLHGGFRPYRDLGEAPALETPQATMDWLLEKSIELTQEQLAQLQAVPEDQRTEPDYRGLVEHLEAKLQQLRDTQTNGFGNSMNVSIDSIRKQAEARRKASGAS